MIYPVGAPRSALRHIGRAIDYRLRYYFDLTPYDKLVAYRGTLFLDDWTDYISTPASRQLYRRGGDLIVWYDEETGKRLCIYNMADETAHSVGSVDSDTLIKLVDMSIALAYGEQLPESVDEWDESKHVSLPPDVLGDFFRSLDSLLAGCSPVGRRLSESDEDQINRYCFALSQLEAVARGEGSGIFQNGIVDIDSVEEILNYAEQPWIDDLRNLSWRFYDKYNHVLSLPRILNPVFEGSADVGGADADLIIGQTLLEIKTVKYWMIESQSALRQLLGYVLLDYSDEYKIKRIGMYMTRQGVMLRWDLDTLIRSMSSGKSDSLEELRHQFREIAQDEQSRIPALAVNKGNIAKPG